jgi:hypothetical protein
MLFALTSIPSLSDQQQTNDAVDWQLQYCIITRDACLLHFDSKQQQEDICKRCMDASRNNNHDAANGSSVIDFKQCWIYKHGIDLLKCDMILCPNKRNNEIQLISQVCDVMDYKSVTTYYYHLRSVSSTHMKIRSLPSPPVPSKASKPPSTSLSPTSQSSSSYVTPTSPHNDTAVAIDHDKTANGQTTSDTDGNNAANVSTVESSCSSTVQLQLPPAASLPLATATLNDDSNNISSSSSASLTRATEELHLKDDNDDDDTVLLTISIHTAYDGTTMTSITISSSMNRCADDLVTSSDNIAALISTVDERPLEAKPANRTSPSSSPSSSTADALARRVSYNSGYTVIDNQQNHMHIHIPTPSPLSSTSDSSITILTASNDAAATQTQSQSQSTAIKSRYSQLRSELRPWVDELLRCDVVIVE